MKNKMNKDKEGKKYILRNWRIWKKKGNKIWEKNLGKKDWKIIVEKKE